MLLENIFLYSSEVYISYYAHLLVVLGSLGVSCSPRDPRFADSNPAEIDEIFQDVNIVSSSPRGGTLSWGSEISGSLKKLMPEKIGL